MQEQFKKTVFNNYNEDDLAPHELQKLANYKEDIISATRRLGKGRISSSALGEKRMRCKKH